MASKPTIPQGTRDFSTEEVLKREFIFDTMKSIFMLYGYQPIETPAMENLTTLLGKYGEEGDKLLFRILNSGDYLLGINEEQLLGRQYARLSSLICEKGLRYDLTVPFARYVVQHREKITLPFKRYQIQPVWRADRPQKGRYREFCQCDVDVIGSNSLLNEYELIRIIDAVFKQLNIKIIIKINNRKILSGIAEIIGAKERIVDITVAIDKLEKIGLDKVNSELLSKGLSQNNVLKLLPFLSIKGKTKEKLSSLSILLSRSSIGMEGIDEIKSLFAYFGKSSLQSEIELDLTLARGLNYYTGAIIEVKSKEINLGSLCGGGRYDNLTGVFGLDGVSGVGISFGAERIYDIMTQLNLFKLDGPSLTQFMIINFGKKELKFALRIQKILQQLNINSELYPDTKELKKQVSYAVSRKIPYIIMAGDVETAQNSLIIRNMLTKQQKLIRIMDLKEFLLNQKRRKIFRLP